MAYQRTQPCLPPPVYAQQCSPGGQEPSACASSCSTAGIDYSMAQQKKQVCLPPPLHTQPCPVEMANAPGPAFLPLCNAAVMADPGPAASAEVSSSSGSPHTGQPGLPLVDATRPYAAEAVLPSVTLLSHADAEACPASYPEATPAYVTPGSTVTLHPSGSIVVRPGPVEVANVSEGAPMPHFS